MEKVRRYRRNLAWVLVLAMTLGIVVPVMPQVTAYAEEANTESSVVLNENGVLKIENIDTVAQETLGKIDKEKICQIEFGSTVKTIDDHVFENCHNLTEITWGGVEKIGSYAFADCENLDMMSLSYNVEAIEEGAFRGCSKVEFVVVPPRLKTLGNNAFPLAVNLFWQENTFPEIPSEFWRGRTGTMMVYDTSKWQDIIDEFEDEKITWSGRRGGQGCMFVQKQGENGISEGYYVSFNATESGTICRLKQGRFCVERVYNREEIEVDNLCFDFPNGWDAAQVKTMTLKKQVIPNRTFSNLTQLETLEIEAEKVTIPSNAFQNLTNLTSVKIPGCAELQEGCFSGCTALSELEIGTYMEIGSRAFKGCKSLSNLQISCAAKIIGEEAFAGCTGLTGVKITKRAEKIAKRAFYQCEKLSDVSFPIYTTRIEREAFGECTNIKEVVLPQRLTYLGLGNFVNADIYWPRSQVKLQTPEEEELSFFEQAAGTMYIPSGVTFWQTRKEMYPSLNWQSWEAPTEEPGIERHYYLSEQLAFTAEENNVKIRACVDEEGVPCTQLCFTRKYQRVAFYMPEGIYLGDYDKVSIKARIAGQLMFDVRDEDLLVRNGFSNMDNQPVVNCTYPFFEANDTQGGNLTYGTEEVELLDYNGLEAKYMTIGNDYSPTESETTEKPYEFYIYSVTFQSKSEAAGTIVFESKMPDTPETETPSATYNPWEPTYNPWEPTQLPSASSAPTTTLKPTELPSVSQTPSAIPQPTETPTASQTPSDTPKPVEPPSASASVEASVVPSKKQSKRPSIWIQKKGNRKLRYVQITVKSSVGRYFDLYMKRRGKKFVRIRLAKNSLKKGKRVVKLVYVQKGYTLWFKVRTYDKINGKKKYRAYSGQKKIRL
ncbi:MAG: leucine-rich repeat protein [Roseburia sp.]|nr:leucine-rich repeat protein [Roseburia sp.]